MNKTIFMMITMILLVTSGLKAQNQVFFPVDSIPGITIRLDGDDTVTVVTAPAVVTETQPQVLERTWANLERGLKEIMQSPEMLSRELQAKIQYIYKVKDVPCYGDLWLCITVKSDGSKEYLVSRTDVEDIDPILGINVKSCRKGNDTGVISTPNIGRPRPIPRRKK